MTDNDTLQTGLNYELLVEDALRSVVRSSLRIVEKVGLPGETHFYISFLTNYTGVEIDDHLRVKHPETMTIVLQHQFADLVVGETEFAVTLFFGGKASPMIIPFEALTSFNDPSVGFGLQFGMADDDDHDDDDSADHGRNAGTDISQKDGDFNGDNDHSDKSQSDDQPPRNSDNGSGNSADVVSLDTFRKRPTK
ncbi:SspB family protein [Alphaproteobacteria bacterium LSUCC0396]